MKIGVGLGVAHPVSVDYNSRRATFVAQVTAALGGAPVAGYLPHRDDTTTSICPWSGRVWTADATMAGQITALGLGSQRTFNGSSNNLTTPDTNDLSFDGTADVALTTVVLGNVTDTASARAFYGKHAASNGEYQSFLVGATDVWRLWFTDQSAGVSVHRSSDAAVAMGANHLYIGTYDGTAGATAMNGAALLLDGTAIASTATNNAGYVSMENLTSTLQIGSSAGASFYQGTMALVLFCLGVKTAPQIAALETAVNTYFGLAL